MHGEVAWKGWLPALKKAEKGGGTKPCHDKFLCSWGTAEIEVFSIEI